MIEFALGVAAVSLAVASDCLLRCLSIAARHARGPKSGRHEAESLSIDMVRSDGSIVNTSDPTIGSSAVVFLRDTDAANWSVAQLARALGSCRKEAPGHIYVACSESREKGCEGIVKTLSINGLIDGAAVEDWRGEWTRWGVEQTPSVLITRQGRTAQMGRLLTREERQKQRLGFS